MSEYTITFQFEKGDQVILKGRPDMGAFEVKEARFIPPSSIRYKIIQKMYDHTDKYEHIIRGVQEFELQPISIEPSDGPTLEIESSIDAYLGRL